MSEEPKPPADAGGDTKDAAYWQAEAKKAFQDRDAAKARAKELEGRALTDAELAERDELRAAKAKADEDQKKKAGEWDSLRESLTKKHADEIKSRDEKLTASEQRWKTTMVGLAFAGASDLFGKDALTIYTPKAAERIFGDYVTLNEDGTVIVKDGSGNVMLDAKTGKPASFSAAMRELIESLPDKNDHLRGSGKTGSGNSGGAAGGVKEFDLKNLSSLTPEQRRDPNVLKALRASLQGGGVVFGEAYNR